MKTLAFNILAIVCAFGAVASNGEMQKGKDAAIASFVFLSCVAAGAAACGAVALLEEK